MMRKMVVLGLMVVCSSPAGAWVPKLEETTAKNVIDGAYGRRDPLPTFLALDLNVKDGQFAAGKDAVKVFDGGEACLSDWLAAPLEFGKGSRPVTVTVSGQADQLYFQAQAARDGFRNLSVADALGGELTKLRLADGELRVDVAVRGLPSEKARGAYLVRMRGPDGKLIAPVRSSYVNDWKPTSGAAPAATSGTAATVTAPATTSNAASTAPAAQGTAAPALPAPAPLSGPIDGTLVYYFEPLKAGLGASDRTELLLRTEADTNCAYSLPIDLSKFQ